MSVAQMVHLWQLVPLALACALVMSAFAHTMSWDDNDKTHSACMMTWIHLMSAFKSQLYLASIPFDAATFGMC